MPRHTDALVGFLIGAAAGGITALLLAPQKGKVTRRSLRYGGEKLLHEGAAMVTHAAATIDEAVREKGHAASAATRQQVHAARGVTAEAMDTYHRELEKS